MPRMTFVGQSSQDDDNRPGNTSRLLNFYRERLGVGGKSEFALKSVLGTALHAQTADLFVRDMVSVGGRFYALIGGNLYDVREDGAYNLLGATVSAAGAKIFGAESNRVCTVTDGRYFVWDGSTMAEPATGAFSAFGSGAFFGEYVLLTEANGRRFQWSDLADAKTLPGLNFATAESTDTNILRVVPLQGRVWLMKEDVIEQWYTTGQSGANAFATQAGGVHEVGLKAVDLVTRFTGGVFFVGNDDIAYISNGGQLQPVSSPAVNTSLAQSTPVSCFVYEDEGHKFCCVAFSDRPAWVYDIVTGEWHERASGKDSAWNITTTAKAFNKWYGGDSFGKIYQFSRSNADADGPLYRTAVSATLHIDGAQFRISLAEFTGRVGQGGDATQIETWSIHYPNGQVYYTGVDDLTIPDDAVWRVSHEYAREPSLMLRMSRDGGHTWSSPRMHDLGAVGEYDQRIRFRNLGVFEKAVGEITLTTPNDITLDADISAVVA